MQSILTTGLLKPVCDSKSASIVQFNSSASGEFALFSYISDSQDKSSAQQRSFILSIGAKNEELYNEPGSVLCCSHDLSQVICFFNKELHIHVRSSTNAYSLSKIYSLIACTPKFASLVTLTTGQTVLIVLGALSQKLSPEEVSKYFNECSHQDPLKIAASYTFLYVLNSDTGTQINSFLIPIKRRNGIADISYDTAGLLHIYYRNSQDTLLKLVVKPLEFYNLQFTKDNVSLLDSRGDCVRPLSPSITQHILRLEAIHASKMCAPEPLFGKLRSSSITLHVLCDYVNAKCVYHIYEEELGSNRVCTLLKEVIHNSAMCISANHDRLYYIDSRTSILQTIGFNELVQYILQEKQSFCGFTWTNDNTTFFKEFCASSSTPITLISREEFESYLKMIESLHECNDPSLLQSNASDNETQQQDATGSNRAAASGDHDAIEAHTPTQDFSILSNSVITELAEEPSDSSEPATTVVNSVTHSHVSASSFNELAARVVTLEETLKVQSADHRKLIKELEEFYDTMSSIADKQAKLSRKLDDFMRAQVMNASRNIEDKARTMPTGTSIDICTVSRDQSQTLGANLRALAVTLYHISINITGLAVKLVKRASSKLSAHKNA